MICDKCGVVVTADANVASSTRAGLVRFDCLPSHPLVADDLGWFVDAFPVAPLKYRLAADGSPNALGLKYERVVVEQMRLERRLSQAKSKEERHEIEQDAEMALLKAMRDALGVTESGRPVAPSASMDTAFSVLFTRLMAFDPYIDQLFRCCLLTLDLQARI